MSLASGTRLGPYEIASLIGAGGMGEVYAATDTRLGRSVALKILPAEVSADPDRRARFEREARTVGALSHPNIVAIHDVGTVADVTFLVMELLEGETLRSRLNETSPGDGARPRGGLPRQKALGIAAQVAQGLAAAHARGIVHRDLKPENIFLTTDGRVKVLDFGLARAMASAQTNAETRTTPIEAAGATQPGMVMGTVGYMAPEQVRGRDADHRADIFALGAVLYEMLTGARAFLADSAIETMSAILTIDPLERRDIVSTVPAPLEALVRHCLEKQPDERFQSARDLAFQMEALAGSAASGAVAAPSRVTRQRTPLALAGVATVALLIAGAFAAGRWTLRGPASFDVGLPDDAPIALVDATPWATEHPSIAVSPGGEFMVYVARRGESTEIWYRSLITTEAMALPGSSGGFMPFLSPDGRWVGFFVLGVLKKVAADGATPAVSVAAVSEPRGAVWLSEDQILVAPNFGQRLEIVQVTSGRTAVIDQACDQPAARIEAQRIAVVCGGRDQPQHIWHVVPLGSDGKAGTLIPIRRLADASSTVAGGDPKVIGDLLLWVTYDGELAAAKFDLTNPSVATVGTMAVVERHLRRSRIWSTAHYDVTRAGDLVYVPGSNAGVGYFVVAGPRQGGARALPIPSKQYLKFAPSPDGRRIAATAVGVGETVDLWLCDVRSGQCEPVATGSPIGQPVWQSDEALVFTTSTPEGKARLMVADLTRGNATRAWEGLPITPEQFVGADTIVGTDSTDITVARLDSTPHAVKKLELPDNQYFPVVSPDRSWLVYSGSEKGGTDAYATPFPAMDYQIRLSANGGSEPVFLADGSVVFRLGTRWYRVPRTTSGKPFGSPEPYWSDDALMNTSGLSNAVMPDGDLLYLRSVAPSTAGYVRVVRGWLERARAMVR